jgi:hypothetical protein
LTVIIVFFARLAAGYLQPAQNEIARCVHQVIVLLDDLALFIAALGPYCYAKYSRTFASSARGL